MISGINLEIINYLKIVIVEKLITFTSTIFFRLSIASSSNAYYPNSTSTGYLQLRRTKYGFIVRIFLVLGFNVY